MPGGGRQAGDRLGARLVDPEWRTADEAFFGVVEVIGVEVVHAHAVAAGADERVGKHVFIKERLDGGHVLVGEVAPDHAFAGHRIVRLADAGQQHQVHVVELERAQDHQIGRLFNLAALRIDVVHAGGAGLVVGQVDLQHVGVGA